MRAVIDPPWGGGTKEIISLEGVHPSILPTTASYNPRDNLVLGFSLFMVTIQQRKNVLFTTKIEVTICQH